MLIQQQRRGIVVLWSSLALALAVTGCGSTPTGNVSGKVMFEGKPLAGGYVAYVGSGTPPKTVSSVIDEQGRYSITNAPVGPVQITIQGPSGTAIGPDGRPITTGDPVVIPSRYMDADKSGLTYTVNAGSQDYPIYLLP
jgi:hypothetical protein